MNELTIVLVLAMVVSVSFGAGCLCTLRAGQRNPFPHDLPLPRPPEIRPPKVVSEAKKQTVDKCEFCGHWHSHAWCPPAVSDWQERHVTDPD